MKKVIVTGGAGFIGSHLVDLLLREGYRVTVIDNLATGRLDNLKEAGESAAFEFVRQDISDLEKIQPHFSDAEWVFHCAALADIVPSVVEPHRYHKANVDGTMAVLEASRRCGIKKFIYTASSSCYGIPKTYPTAETAPVQPQYPYAFTKYVGESYAFFWSQMYKLPVVSLRLFNVYGPRSRTSGTYGAVLGVFLAQKLAGEPFTVVGDGTQRRDFIYVEDVARAFLKAAESDAQNEILNVGTQDPQDINTLVSFLGGEVVYIPRRPGEPDCTWADITRITDTLGWRPQVTFKEGIARVVEQIDYWRSAPVWTPESIAQATQEWFKYLAVKEK